MGNYTHQTAPTQFVEATGIRLAYRRFANRRFGKVILQDRKDRLECARCADDQQAIHINWRNDSND